MSKEDTVNEFESVLRTWSDRIYGLALRLSCRTDEAEEIAQETFVKACEHWEDFQGDSDPGTWLYRICVNVWKNRVRSEVRRRFWFDRQPQAAEAEPPPSRKLEANDRRQCLDKALARLEPDDRAILVMREVEDRSCEEIAEWLDIPVGTVKSRLSRTREKLKKLYGDME